MYDPSSGRILIDGNDIKAYDISYLRKQIGYVPQDNFLFTTTIRDNIRFSDPTIPQDEVEKAAKVADIHDDIIEMVNGYDTETGERGVSLSGGQKQRVAIARAVIKNPDLMILDDSLSAVDAKTEEEILSGLKDLRNDQTSIIIAHRISSLMHADEILVLEDGKIMDFGSHEELFKRNDLYQNLCKIELLSK